MTPHPPSPSFLAPDAAQEKRQHGKCDYSLPNVRKSYLFCGLLDCTFLRWYNADAVDGEQPLLPPSTRTCALTLKSSNLCVCQAEKLAELKPPDKHSRIFKALLSQAFFFWLDSKNSVASFKIKAGLERERSDRGHGEAG